MNYIKVSFKDIPEHSLDLLLANFSVLEHNGMEESKNGLAIFFEEEHFPKEICQQLAQSFDLSFELEQIMEKDWNETWEANFQPIIIDNFCSVRAHFHPKPEDVLFDIVITPKMSFGTGHHATTSMMISMMKDLNFHQKSVFDFGTGTGILAILATMMGASSVTAIDNDKWSVENAVENLAFNKVNNVHVEMSTIDQVKTKNFDIILANINRSVLLDTMSLMAQKLKNGGSLLLSGILMEDADMIISCAQTAGFVFIQQKLKDGWIALHFELAK